MLRYRLAVAEVVAAALAGTLALAAPAARAEEPAASGGSAKEQVKAGFKETGRAIGRGATALGHMFRDGAKETWRATKPAREGTKEAGREVGHAAAKGGRAIGGAAKDAGHSVKQAVKGKGGEGAPKADD